MSHPNSSDSSHLSVFQINLLPVWVGLGVMATVPFLSIFRVGPQAGFFLETISVLSALSLVLMTVMVARHLNPLNPSLNSAVRAQAFPHASIYFLILAVFWAIQARVLDVVYIGLSDMMAWVWVVFALLAWACRRWVRAFGQESIVTILAWVILIGTLLQSVVAWLQYTDLASHFSGYLMYRKGIVEGQLGQRNHFGHYMMWGVLSVAFLWGTKRLNAWIALLILLSFSAVMGLTGSRTIFAYLLGLVVLLPAWWILAGRVFNRLACVSLVALALVAFGQFGIESILQLFSENNTVDSAVERLNNSSFSHSGRNYEWKKAWLIFLSAPFWGYGWGSYALQGFLETSVYGSGFRPYEGNVLFTHSHNSFLNLLAEMGLMGTALILGGLAFCVKTAFKKPRTNASFYLLAMMLVSLLHSFLEYPLWYIYFLTVFVVFVSLFPDENGFQVIQSKKSCFLGFLNKPKIALGLILLLNLSLMIGVMRLAWVYQELRVASVSSKMATEKANKLMKLLTISKTEPMLQYYADLSLLDYIEPKDASQPTWAYDVAKRSSLFRPYANAHKWGFVAYQAGEQETARTWLQHMYRYYPTKFGVYGAIVMNSEHYHGLRDDYTKLCQQYYQAIRKPSACAEALLPLDKIQKNEAASSK